MILQPAVHRSVYMTDTGIVIPIFPGFISMAPCSACVIAFQLVPSWNQASKAIFLKGIPMGLGLSTCRVTLRLIAESDSEVGVTVVTLTSGFLNSRLHPATTTQEMISRQAPAVWYHLILLWFLQCSLLKH